MATSLKTKIVLTNTTKMTLNERFTTYRAQAQTANTYRKQIQQARQASSANLRLAQQMANRPTVLAALRIKKKSLQQRLGRKQQFANGNIKSRLNLGKRLNNQSIRGRLGNMRGRGRNMNRRGGYKSGTSPLMKDRLGVSRFRSILQTNPRTGFRNRRGNFRGGNRNSKGGIKPQVQRNIRNVRGRGRGRGWWNNKVPGGIPTKQELDNQLDEYMAETKSSLDAQLGQYMSQG